uniref:Uncharacterized protein n=1 Tax=Anguilla anguilla TaxID=7936 RepID=A0A0E9UJ86_ANGAN
MVSSKLNCKKYGLLNHTCLYENMITFTF